jgi:hypothetical protein
MSHNNSVKKLIQDALQQRHKESTIPREEQWFTRASIAKQLKAPSGGLNPSRKFALADLVRDGVVEQRKKPDDGKMTLEFRLKKG